MTTAIPPREYPVIRATRTALAGMLVTVWLLANATIAMAQQGGSGEFQSYSIRHSTAAEAERALSRIVPLGTDIVSDAQNNRLLVRGPATTHQLIANALTTIDQPKVKQPAVAAVTNPTGSGAVLKVYPSTPGEAQALSDRLRQEFAYLPDVRVAADPRTAQVLVLATPEVHMQIAQRMAGAGASAPAIPAPGPAATPVHRSTVALPADTRRIDLRNTTPLQVEAELATMLGHRIAPTSSAAGQKAFVLRAPNGGAAEITLDLAGNAILVRGTGPAAESTSRLIQAIDQPGDGPAGRTQLVSLKSAKPVDVRKAVSALQSGNLAPAVSAPNVPLPGARSSAPLAMMYQQPDASGGPRPAPAAAGAAGAARKPDEGGSISGPVQIEMLEGLDVVIIRGHQRDVDQVMDIIKQIERLSTETQPAIEIFNLQFVGAEEMAQVVTQLYIEVFAPRQGDVSIISLGKPNALLLVGRPENVKTAAELVKRLDQPVPPDSMFRIFALKRAAATAVQSIVQDFFSSRGGLSSKARVTVDYRTNALVVQASQRDLAEVAELIERIDTGTNQAVNELRIFKLDNSLANDIASVLADAISGQGGAARPAGAAAGAAAQGAARSTAGDQKSTMLNFLAVDPKGQRLLKSGILSDVRITPDVRANTLVVSAPAESMDLIETLIKELDRGPATSAQIKVFTIINADALNLVDMLQTLFPQPTATSNQVSLAQNTAAGDSESSLVPLRFAVDSRTNSIIASGSSGDLNVVEAILLRLDDSDVRHRKSTVYRLKNAPAADVATAINNFLQNERLVQQLAPGVVSPFEQMEREVVVVPETVSNSLIVSATPRFYDEIQSLVEQLDKRPPMVMIQVLIAEVTLNNFDEFGIELGLQDSVLFDRSLLSNIQYLTQSTQTPSGNTVVTSTNQSIVTANNTPGFNFNNQDLGNSGAAQAVSGANRVGSQSLSNFSVGRTNSKLGYGGLVLSASSESVSVLIRALQECQRLDILSRPQVMTLDNQPAFIQVGQRVPRISGSTINATGQINNVVLENVGLILGVTPRISPDGLVVMEIDAEKSEVGPEAEGVPISINNNGQVIRSPRIDTTTAQTTVSALSGQTVILGGLIRKNKTEVDRRVPYLSSIPILGNLFKYRSHDNRRSELLIIMTPHIVTSEEDIQRLKQVEAARMSWCLADVYNIHGDIGIRQRGEEWHDGETKVVRPDDGSDSPTPATLPEAVTPPEPVPTPADSGKSSARSGVQVEDKTPSLAPPKPATRKPTPPGTLQLPDGAHAWPPANNSQMVSPAGYQYYEPR